MTNNEIIINQAIAHGIYTKAEAQAIVAAKGCLPIHTFAEWKKAGYSVKRGEHAAITCDLWKYTERPGKAAKAARAEAANAYYRKHKTLRGYASLTDEQADALTDPEAFSIKLYGKPYGDFELSSLRGKIKRIQARLADLDKLQAAAQQPDNTTKFDGGEIVRNAEENRLQILFDEIPDADTRDALKSNGFRWSPRNKAWQRQLTQNAEYAARRVLGL